MSFEAYLTGEGLDHTLPGIETIEEGVEIYYQYYERDSDLVSGVLAFELEIVS